MADKTRQGAGRRVCVTGASGFIGTHIVRELLERGYRVRGTVRDPGDQKKCAHINILQTVSERVSKKERPPDTADGLQWSVLA